MNGAAEQLNGWKEIACYLNRSVRCVQRWERNEELPVRRHGHRRGVSVYAFREELGAWWKREGAGSDQFGIEPVTLTAKDERRGRESNHSEGSSLPPVSESSSRPMGAKQNLPWPRMKLPYFVFS